MQLYCDVHRLLLEMIVEYPDIQYEATKKLEDFVSKNWSRGRDVTPDIGVLIQYLAVADKMTWEDFRTAYLEESFRRSARWIPTRIGRRLAIEESDEDLVRHWFEGSKVSISLMLFNVAFLKLVGRPDTSDLAAVRSEYDRNWGRVPDDIVAKIRTEYKEIESVKDLEAALARIGANKTIAEIATLIRWAIQNEKEIAVPREIKTASSTTVANAAYQRLVVRRTYNSSAPSKTTEAVAYQSALATSYTSVLQTEAAIVNFSADLLSSTFGAVSDGPVGFLRRQSVDSVSNVRMLRSVGDHTVLGRSRSIKVPEACVLKEMLFLVDDKPVLVLKNGDVRVDMVSLKTLLNASTVRLCATSYIALHTSYAHYALPAFGHRVSQPPQVVVAASISQMKPDTVVFTSAGCEKFFFALDVSTLLALLVGSRVLDV